MIFAFNHDSHECMFDILKVKASSAIYCNSALDMCENVPKNRMDEILKLIDKNKEITSIQITERLKVSDKNHQKGYGNTQRAGETSKRVGSLKNGHIKGHIDHFYPKAKYPYFAMNFYNFIPACESCNKVKHEFDTTDILKKTINTYERTNEKIFTLEISAVDDFSYKLNEDNLLKELHIEKIYNAGDKDIIEELYIKFFQRDTKEHFDSLRKSLSGIGIDVDEVHRSITCGYLKDEDYHKRSLSKLIKDISEELQLVY